MYDLTNKRFGLLVAKKQVHKNNTVGNIKVYWECICDCGNIVTIKTTQLTKRRTSSCGCRKGTITHGHTVGKESRTHCSWWAMIRRCYNPNDPSYHLYGGRGIRVCDSWLGDSGFENFLRDMGERPEKTSLDRISSIIGNYQIDNCRWANSLTQAVNRRGSLNSRSKFKGVGFHKKSNAWRAYITSEGKQNHLGTFNTEIEAAKAYNKAAFELWGPDAYLNPIEEDKEQVATQLLTSERVNPLVGEAESEATLVTLERT
jgi:hypothetical protein